MKKHFFPLIFICIMCIFSSRTVFASCPKDVSRDLTKEAYYVKANYEIVDKSTYKEVSVNENTTTYKIPRYEFIISIYNITENIYAVIKNDVDDTTRVINYADTEEGVYTFVDKEFGQIYKYDITVYPVNGECQNKKLKTIKLDRPMYNAYSEYSFCKNSSNYYCQKFTKTKLNIKGNKDFLSKIKINNLRRSEEIKVEEEKQVRSWIDVILSNWQMYAGIFAGSIVVSIILLFAIKRRKNKKGWEE